MKRIKVILFLILANFCGAQNMGFFGKKNIIDINLFSFNPFIYNVTGNDQRTLYTNFTNDSYQSVRKFVDLGYGISYFRSIKKGLSLGLEYYRQNIEIGAPSDFEKVPYSYYDSQFALQYNYNTIRYSGKHELFDFVYSYTMPKIEFSNKSGIFGLGVNHQIGLGIGSAKFIQKDYSFFLTKRDEETNQNIPLSNSEKTEFQTNFFDFNNNKYRFYIFSYSINFRKPITKFMMLSYGFKYNLSYMDGFSKRSIEDNDYSKWMSYKEVGNLIYPKVMTNILQLKLGVNFVF